MDIVQLRELLTLRKIKWSNHCLERMGEREISISDVKNAVLNGEIIEDYPDDYPNPSCLILGYNNIGEPVHVVAGSDGTILYMITTYKPSTDKFAEDMKTRR